MSHFIQAFIAKDFIISDICRKWSSARKLPLKQDFALLPLSEAFKNVIRDNTASTPPENMTSDAENHWIQLFLKEQSKQGKIMWFKTSYTGASGYQEALYCEQQKLSETYYTHTKWNDIKMELVDRPKGTRAINKALYQLGVQCKYRDEFGALDLTSLHSIEFILNKIEALKPSLR